MLSLPDPMALCLNSIKKVLIIQGKELVVTKNGVSIRALMPGEMSGHGAGSNASFTAPLTQEP